MPIYKISAALNQFNKQLTTAQRNSSLFSEVPVVAGKTLRRGVEIALTEAQYLAQKSKIDMQVKAGAITLKVFGEDGHATADVRTDPTAPLTVPVVDADVQLPPEGVLAPGVQEAVTDLVKDTVVEAVSVVAPEAAPIVEAVLDAAIPDPAPEVVQTQETPATVEQPAAEAPVSKKKNKGK